MHQQYNLAYPHDILILLLITIKQGIVLSIDKEFKLFLIGIYFSLAVCFRRGVFFPFIRIFYSCVINIIYCDRYRIILNFVFKTKYHCYLISLLYNYYILVQQLDIIWLTPYLNYYPTCYCHLHHPYCHKVWYQLAIMDINCYNKLCCRTH